MKRALLILCVVLCSLSEASAKFRPKPFEKTFKYRGEVAIGGSFSTKLHIPPQKGLLVEAGGETQLSRPFFETVHGVMISDYIFIGGGLGLQYYAGECGDDARDWIALKTGAKRWNTLTIPLFVNLKGFLPINDDLKPFINLSLGGSVVACSSATGEIVNKEYSYVNKRSFKLKGGFYCDFGVGVEYKRWIFGLGLQHQRVAQESNLSYSYGYGDTETRSYNYKAYINSFYLKIGVAF
jgi:hypothetical protein